MDKKQDYIDYIENSSLVKAALKKVGDPDQKKRIMDLTRAYAEQIADTFVPIIKRLKEDPNYAAQLKEQIKNGKQAVDIEEKKDD